MRTLIVTLAAAIGLAIVLLRPSLPAVSLVDALRPSPQEVPPAATLLQVLTGLNAPLFLTHAGDGSNRLFLLEKGGTIRVIVNGELQTTPFLDIRAIVNSRLAEHGLLGLAFHPGYAANGRFFVAYTASDGALTLARYQVSEDANRADPDSSTVLLAIPDPFPYHNGGMLAFGPDGYLYVGTANGAEGADHSQNLGSLLGKLLRLDIDNGEPYAIPPSNPFTHRPEARPEIWAFGLRNPWRFSFDRMTGDLFIGDVGNSAYEEINVQPAGSLGGENYGWRVMEAFHCFRRVSCDRSGLTLPIASHSHDLDCSVIGGHVYRGTSVPALRGVYVYGDFCSGRLRALRQAQDGRWVNSPLMNTTLKISSLGEDQDGELYLTDLSGGMYRFADVTAATPSNKWIEAYGPATAPLAATVMSTESHALSSARLPNGKSAVLSEVQIKDAAGAPVPSAMVKVEIWHSSGENAMKTAKSDQSGRVSLRFEVSEPGHYTAQVLSIVLSGAAFEPGPRDFAPPVTVQ
jgi:glucose/arabinose dehydrogenase